MNITVLGLGYIGTVTVACLGKTHNVTGVDLAKNKVDLINEGKSPIIEPSVDDLIQSAHQAGRLKAKYDSEYRLDDTDAVIICVGTPSSLSGDVDLTSLVNLTKIISNLLKDTPKKPAIIYRSTVLPGTMNDVILALYNHNLPSIDFPILYHPEFLREGAAVADFFNNPQIVAAPLAGTDEDGMKKIIDEIYKGINYRYYPVEVKTAEMIKYLNNAYHALKVVFVNEVARLCAHKEIDTHALFKIFMEDSKLNISKTYLAPGFAFGGSCLPKDLRGITSLARQLNIDIPILSSIARSNDDHINYAFEKILNTGADRIGFFGLSFKPGTDDVRESPYVKLIENLIGKGKEIKIFDESIKLNTILGKNLEYLIQHIPHISKRMVEHRDDLLRDVQLIVLCHHDKKFIEECQSQRAISVMDLTGKLKLSDMSINTRSLILSKTTCI